MSIIDIIKNLILRKNPDILAGIDNMNLSTLNSVISKFDLYDEIDKISPNLASSIKDGQISQEELMAFMPEIKALIKKYI